MAVLGFGQRQCKGPQRITNFTTATENVWVGETQIFRRDDAAVNDAVFIGFVFYLAQFYFDCFVAFCLKIKAWYIHCIM